MPAATLPKLMTTAELLALPENDGMERWLINGELREKPVTKRNRFHSKIMATVSQILKNWLDSQPPPRGDILCGEAGVILEHDPDTTAGIDVVYIPHELSAVQNDETTLIDGIPSLAVEILSPSDTQKEIDEKTDKYLAVGIPHIWIIDSHDRTVLVHRPGELPKLFTVRDELTAEPELPGFRTAVSRIFE
jgi:Uma2 family endonuclease